MIYKALQFLGIVAMLWAISRDDSHLFILGALFALVGSHFDNEETKEIQHD